MTQTAATQNTACTLPTNSTLRAAAADTSTMAEQLQPHAQEMPPSTIPDMDQ